MLQCHGLDALEEIGLTKLCGMEACCALALADENGMHLLTQRAFPGCHHTPCTTPDSVNGLRSLG
jgi:hypothetical protein